jgi:hypothetical protein
MLFKSIFATAVLFAASSVALPTDLEARQQATTCGSTSYSASQVRSAVNAGYGDYQAGRTYGSNDYPHKVCIWLKESAAENHLLTKILVQQLRRLRFSRCWPL